MIDLNRCCIDDAGVQALAAQMRKNYALGRLKAGHQQLAPEQTCSIPDSGS